MNFRKTWFGYLNFAVSVIITGALVMALVFFSVFKINISNASTDTIVNPQDPMFWAFLGISVAAIALIALIVFIVRKIRIKILLKVPALKNPQIVQIVGGVLALAFFVSGLVLRIRFVLNHSFEPSFNVDVTNDMFWGTKVYGGFYDFDLLYCKFMAFLYRFIGIKPQSYIWLNLVLSSLILIVVFMTVRILFDEITACVPMAFLCFSSAIYTRIALGSGDYIKYLIISVLLLIAVKVLSLFENTSVFSDFGLILIHIVILLFLFVLPLIASKSVNIGFLFDLSREKLLYDLFNNTYLFMGIVIFMLVAEINFLFSDRDRLSPVSFIWIVALFFFMFTNNTLFNSSWPGDQLMLILFTVFAGLGVSELLFSEVYEADVEEEPVKKQVVVHKPESKSITRIGSAKLLTSETTKVKETEETASVTSAIKSVYVPRPASFVSGIVSDDQTVRHSLPVQPEPEEKKPVFEEVSPAAPEPAEEKTPVFEEAAPGRPGPAVEKPVTETETATPVQKPVVTEPVKLFENPLPLPKAHVKRDLSYKFEPDESQMKFDIDIKDGDDFDI